MINLNEAIELLRNGTAQFKDNDDNCMTEGELVILLEELQRYKKLEKEKLLIKLPCSVIDNCEGVGVNFADLSLEEKRNIYLIIINEVYDKMENYSTIEEYKRLEITLRQLNKMARKAHIGHTWESDDGYAGHYDEDGYPVVDSKPVQNVE